MCGQSQQQLVNSRPGLRQATNGHLASLICPVCGGKMSEALTMKRRGSRFVWLECTKTDCRGLFLRRDLSH